ncbi:hypothetical protein VF13_41210, partial [Nostoc linckia z16]
TGLLLLVFLISCAKKSSGYVIEIWAKGALDDRIQLFYSDSYFGGYDELHSITANLKGKQYENKLVFTLPSEYSLVRFRLDLGDNKAQKSLAIPKIVIRSSHGIKTLDANKICKAFLCNQNCHFSDDCSLIILKEDLLYDPYIISKNISGIAGDNK